MRTVEQRPPSRAAAPRSLRAARLGAWGAGLAFLTYAVFRTLVELGIRGGGRHPTGMLLDDSYYPLAFARELQREGSFLLHNPYGSLDEHARLYDGLALVLRPLAPLWEDHLFAFDAVVSLLAVTVAGFCVGRVVAHTSRQSTAITAFGLLLIVCGSGIGFIAHASGIGPSFARLTWGTGWGVNWLANQLATWELVYHALFWAGVSSLVRRSARGAWAIGLVLALLHPFTFGVYVLFCAAVWVAHTALRRDEAREYRRIVVPLFALAAVAGVVYEVLLPAWSRDANFLLRSYDLQPFAIPTGILLLFLAPAALFALVLLLSRARSPGTGESPWAAAFLLFAASLFVIAVSRQVTTAIPQPAHWTRVYLVAALVIGGLALAPSRPERMRAVAVAAAAITAVAMVDSALAILPIRRDVVRFNSPAVLDASQEQVVDWLGRRPSRLVIYIRRCAHADYIPALEYAISALTPQRVVYGHAYFSPNLGRRARQLEACPAKSRPTFAPGTYVLSDPGVVKSLPLRDRHRVGSLDFGVLR